MALHSKGETKFCLGRNIYVTIKTHNKLPTISILEYINLRTNTGTNVLVPSRSGVTLTPKQFKQLIMNIPLMTSTIESLQPPQTNNTTPSKAVCRARSVPVGVSSDTVTEPLDTTNEPKADESNDILQQNVVEQKSETETSPQLKKRRGPSPMKRFHGQLKKTTCITCPYGDIQLPDPRKKRCKQAKSVTGEQ